MKETFAWSRPESIAQQGPDAARRGRAVLVASGLMAAAGSWVAWVQLTQGSALVAGIAALLAVSSLAIPFVLRRTGAWRPLGYTLCAFLFAAAGSVTVSTGGVLISASFYLGLVPVLATITGGARVGAAWAVACSLLLIGVEALRRSGFEFPVPIAGELVAQSAFRGALIFEALLLTIALVYDWLRRSSLHEVAESEARSRALTDHSGDLVSELDEDGMILFANRSHLETLGWTTEELVGTAAAATLHPDDKERFQAQIHQATRSGNMKIGPVRAGTADGGWRWLEPEATAFTTPDGRQRVVMVARDLTDRMRLEEELRQSQKMEAIGQLAGGVAHDFNNLLMVIMGYAHQLADNAHAPGAEKAMIEEILHAAEQGEGLTRQLLAVSRPGNARRCPLDLNDVATTMQRMLSRLIGEDVLLALQLDDGLPLVFADPGHLEQVLVNLAVNARDAMPEGGTLEIETKRHADGARLVVRDSGVGMDPQTQERVFEAFFTTKAPGKGTGLGLAVVYSIVRSMDGEIHIESQPGRGTTLTIDLPGSAEAVPEPSATSTTTLAGGHETILVVEDRRDVRSFVVSTLENAGYRVIEASDGIDALRKIEHEALPVHLVLSDVVMPRMGGVELAGQLAKRNPRPRMLFMSGHPERGAALTGAPCDGPLLAKPIRPDVLCSRVRDVLDAEGTSEIVVT